MSERVESPCGPEAAPAARVCLAPVHIKGPCAEIAPLFVQPTNPAPPPPSRPNQPTHRQIIQVCIGASGWLHQRNIPRLSVRRITPQLVCLVGQFARLHNQPLPPAAVAVVTTAAVRLLLLQLCVCLQSLLPRRQQGLLLMLPVLSVCCSSCTCCCF